MSTFDEAALRRPDWREGVPVTLCDGQSWHLPRPVLEFYYMGTDPEPRRGTGFGRDVEALVDQLFDCEDDPQRERHLSFLIARALLLQNYDLGDEHFAALLRQYPDSHPRYDENVKMWTAIQKVGLGIVPKA